MKTELFANEIAAKIAEILPLNYKEKIAEKVSETREINHDEDFWNEYKEACIDAYEEITEKEFGEEGEELLEKAEEIFFANKLMF